MDTDKKEKPRHLGRGLQSLLNPTVLERIVSSSSLAAVPFAAATGDNAVKLPEDKELRKALCEIEMSLISANPYQPRTDWDQQQLAELAESIKANGIIQPIVVRPAGEQYQIIAGERRFRAAQLVGMLRIPALVRSANDAQMLEIALVENIHRANLNPIERAKAYQNYLKTFEISQVDAAQRLGEDRSVIANHLRLLDLPEDIKNMLILGELSMGHARAILALPTDELRRKLANRAMARRLSVREVERLVKKYTVEITDDEAGNTHFSHKTPNIIDLENKLTRQLGTKVSINARKNAQRGKIIIEFYSIEEFDRLMQRIGIESLEEV